MSTIRNKNSNTKTNTSDCENIIKFGTFQLQTKSFWISVISILCIFILSSIIINVIFYNKLINKFFDHEEKIIYKMIDNNRK